MMRWRLNQSWDFVGAEAPGTLPLSSPVAKSRRCFLALAVMSFFPQVALSQTKKASKKTKSASSRRSRSSAKGAAAKQKAEPPPPPPWPDSSVQTLAAAVERLRVVPSKNLTKSDLALQAGLEFSLAFANVDGERAAALVEAVGFQPFATNAPLSENPSAPHLPTVIREQVGARQRISLGQTALTNFSIRDCEELRAEFPYMAQWMLADDLAVVISPDEQVANWISEKSVLIIRMRGRRATVAGGNFFQSLAPVAKVTEVG